MKISIITTVRNNANSILSAMQSVARQKTGNGLEIEYIVVDGASTDGTVEEIKNFELRITNEGRAGFSFKWISEKDRNLYDGINKGIRMATGDVIGICNADDVLAEDDVISKIASAFAESKKEEGRSVVG